MKNKKVEANSINLSLKENEAISLFKILSNLSEIDKRVTYLKEKVYNEISSFYKVEERWTRGLKDKYYILGDGYYLQVDKKTNEPQLTCIILNIGHEINIMNTFFCCDNHDEALLEFKTRIDALKILNIQSCHLGEIFEAIDLIKYNTQP
jgi:hypothetical protein